MYIDQYTCILVKRYSTFFEQYSLESQHSRYTLFNMYMYLSPTIAVRFLCSSCVRIITGVYFSQVKNKPWIPWVYTWSWHRCEHLCLCTVLAQLDPMCLSFCNLPLPFSDSCPIFKLQLSRAAGTAPPPSPPTPPVLALRLEISYRHFCFIFAHSRLKYVSASRKAIYTKLGKMRIEVGTKCKMDQLRQI